MFTMAPATVNVTFRVNTVVYLVLQRFMGCLITVNCVHTFPEF